LTTSFSASYLNFLIEFSSGHFFFVTTAPDPEPLYCGWTTYNTLLRIGLTLINILVIVLSFVASIVKKHRVASWMVLYNFLSEFQKKQKNQ
jgi:thiamine transporter ThiT